MFIAAILWLSIIGGLIYLNHQIAKKFEQIVFAKGYGTELKAYYMCFWLGIVGYLYVIALPNAKLDNIELKQHKSLIKIYCQIVNQNIDMAQYFLRQAVKSSPSVFTK